ncbi:MAG: hypothetical protein LBL26_03550 [Peptococcaceae bacterium]|jgi:hypothetical protein|nr:hypothetical protein [Peptococcaceae bacterium]
MSKPSENQNIYVIPPNFIESDTFFGGMFKARNAIEAGVLALAAGLPILSLHLPLTTRIILMCLTALPLALFGLIGIAGENLSSAIFIFFKYLRNRRIVGGETDGVKKNKPRAESSPILRAGISPKLNSAERSKIFPPSLTISKNIPRQSGAKPRLTHRQGRQSRKKQSRRPTS